MNKFQQFLLIAVAIICVNFLGSANADNPVTFSKVQTGYHTLELDKKEKTYWINSKSMKRHNKSCRWYGNTKYGYYTNKKVGSACGICGG